MGAMVWGSFQSIPSWQAEPHTRMGMGGTGWGRLGLDRLHHMQHEEQDLGNNGTNGRTRGGQRMHGNTKGALRRR